jgi:lysophospholipase L1-like esterase
MLPRSFAGRLRRILLRAVLLTAGASVALLLAELLLRLPLVTPHEPVWQAGSGYRLDRDVIYSLRPHSTGVWRSDEFEERRSINGSGLRGPEVKARQSIQTRIIVLGDSLVFGHGVGDGEAWPAQLEARFALAGRDVEVLNAGVPGYGTDQSYQLFALRLRSLEPDLVIFCLYLNDVDDNIRQPLFDIDRESLVPLDARKTSLYLAGLLQRRTPDLFRRTRFYDLLQSRLSGRDPFGLVPSLNPDALQRWSRRKIALEIQGLMAMAQADGFAVLVLGMPHHGLRGGYTWWPEIEALDVWSRDVGREPAWHDTPGLFFARDAHPARTGHQRIAETVYGLLVDRQF